MKKIIAMAFIIAFTPAAQAGWFGLNTEDCLAQKVQQEGTDNKVQQEGTDNKVEQEGTDNKVEQEGTDNKVEQEGTDDKSLNCGFRFSVRDWLAL